MRVFLGAHGTGFAFDRVKQTGFLIYLAAIFKDRNLATCLIFNRLSDEADRVHILDFATCTEFAAGTTHGNVHIHTHGALIHIAVTCSKIANNGPQFGHISLSFIRRAHIRFGNDLHQRNAGTVQINKRHGWMLIVHGFSCILLQMQAFNADFNFFEITFFIRANRNVDDPLPNNWVFELGYLITLRQIRIEIVLTIKY